MFLRVGAVIVQFLGTVGVVDQRDIGVAVGIVLERRDLAGNIELVALEVDDPVQPSSSATTAQSASTCASSASTRPTPLSCWSPSSRHHSF